MTNKHSFVTAHKAQYAVSTLCRHLKISRGWIYGFLTSQDARDQRLVIREARDLELLPKIRAFFKASGKCYGSKRIHPLPGRAFKDCPRGGSNRLMVRSFLSDVWR